MATKSILKAVHIKDARSARNLVDALENSQKRPAMKAQRSAKVTNASRSEIRDMLGKSE